VLPPKVCKGVHNKKPKVYHLRTFGCVVHVKKIGPGISKLTDTSTKMVFIGYETGTKGYRVYDPIAKKLHISRDVIFEERRAWDWKEQTRAEAVDSGFDVEYYSIVGQETPNCPITENAAVTAEPEEQTPG
jgi:hypothetical protein